MKKLESINRLIDLKNKLSNEINQNFNTNKFNLVVAVSDAALDMLLREFILLMLDEDNSISALKDDFLNAESMECPRKIPKKMNGGNWLDLLRREKIKKEYL